MFKILGNADMSASKQRRHFCGIISHQLQQKALKEVIISYFTTIYDKHWDVFIIFHQFVSESSEEAV